MKKIKLRYWVLALVLVVTAVGAATPWKYGVMPHVLGFEHKLYKHGSYKVSYFEAGDSDELVLLLHGMGGDALSSWFEVIGPLSERFHVVAPDLLYSNIVDAKQYNLSHDVRMVELLLRQYNYKKIYIVSLSLGAIVALDYALQGNRVDKAVFISPFARNIMQESRELRNRYGQKPELFFKDIFHSPPPVPDFIMGAHSERLGRVLAALPDISKQVSPRIVAIEAGMKQLQIPNYVVYGAEDVVVSEDSILSFANRLHSKEVVRLPDSGHAVVWDKTRAVIDIINSFF